MDSHPTPQIETVNFQHHLRDIYVTLSLWVFNAQAFHPGQLRATQAPIAQGT
ncbi:hypothetical protein PtB15_16B287 [Puccinia triticina]|nr:hypothetical protein PtB15_16B287 [Puccinia triticina]